MSIDDLNPRYYVGVTTTGRTTSLDEALIGTEAGVLADFLLNEVDKLTGSNRKTTLNFVLKTARNNAASNLLSRSIEIALDPSTGKYSVGEFVIDLVGSTAVTTAVTLAIITFLGPGVAILGFSGLASSLIWSGIKDTFKLIKGTVPTDIQIVDKDGNIKGGVLYEEGLSKENELEAVKALVSRATSATFPSISVGDKIRVVKDTIFDTFSSRIDTIYKVYDGEIVNAITEELSVSKIDLLNFGQKNDPNTNSQIYYENLINQKEFIFTSEENRFFVPLPNPSGEVVVTGLHPGNIIFGSSGSDTLDAFENSGRDPDFLLEDVLILGLEGNDIIKANLEKDIIIGGRGNDEINGSGGEDTAIFSDNFVNYNYSISNNGIITFSHVRGTQKDGTDTLTNIEFAKFKDEFVPLPLDVTETGASITLKFKTTLNRDFLSTSTNFPIEIIGINPQIELTYTVESTDTEPYNPLFARIYNSVDGTLSINGQSVLLTNGRLILSDSYGVNDRYELSFPSGSNSTLNTLFGRKVAVSLSFFNSFTRSKDFVVEQDVFRDTNFTLVEFYILNIRFEQIGFEAPPYPYISVDEFRFRGSPRTPFTVSIDDLEMSMSNKAPIAFDDTTETEVNKAVSIPIADLLLNDSDADADDLILVSVNNPVNATVELSNGNVIFTPNVEFMGEASFDYTIDDGNGGTDIATVTVTVKAVEVINTPPAAQNDSITTQQNVAVSIPIADLLLNDSDADADDLVLVGVSNPVNGAVELNNGNVIFAPNAEFTGEASFAYTIDDSNGGTDIATVIVTVNAVEVINTPPIAQNDSVTTQENTAVSISIANLLSNDTDEDEDILTIESVSNAFNGVVDLNGTEITFTPIAGFNGGTSFAYTINDGNGGTDIATVIVTVNPVEVINTPPVAQNDSVTTQENTTVSISIANLLSNDTDEDEDILTIESVSNAFNGVVDLNGTEITFTPIAGFNGEASFAYTINDGNGDTNTATVSVKVIPNTPPVNPVNIAFDKNANNEVDNLIFDTNSVDSKTDITIKLTNDVLVLGTEAGFDNLIGFYEVTDVNGGIDSNGDSITDLLLGQAGYARAAIVGRVDRFAIRAGSGGDPSRNTTVEQFGNTVISGSKFYAPFLLANAGNLGFEGFVNKEDAESDGQFNDAADFINDQVAYFAFAGANPDGVRHLQSKGNNVFGFEDLPSNLGISDNDFNDAVFGLAFNVNS